MHRCGTFEQHCCWFEGVQCEYVEKANRENYLWQCRLKVQYGTWEAVHMSEEYRNKVQPKMRKAGYSCNCGDWPPDGVACHICGRHNG